MTCTTWPLPCFSISAIANWVMRKKPARLTPSAPAKSASVYSVNGLAMKDAGVVDQRIDAAEPGHGFADHALGGPGIGDIAGHA